MQQVAQCGWCGARYVREGDGLCPHCLLRQRYTQLNHVQSTVLLKALRVFAPIEFAYSLQIFQERSMLHQAIIDLKYHGYLRNGLSLGHLLGRYVASADQRPAFDAIVPVPLHWRKQLIRGYNQSQLIARGMAKELGLPVLHVLRRNRFTTTQTHMPDLARRLNNMSNVFSLWHPERAHGKHLLLVDDVVTTGATIGNCARALRAIPGVRLSLASVAVTMRMFGGGMLRLLGDYGDADVDAQPTSPIGPSGIAYLGACSY